MAENHSAEAWILTVYFVHQLVMKPEESLVRGGKQQTKPLLTSGIFTHKECS